MKNRLLVIALTGFLSACSVLPPKQPREPGLPKVSSLYDVVIYHSESQRAVHLNQVVSALKTADVVFIGEYHGNHASHWLQAQLQAALYAQRPQQVLSMEQFSRDKQTELDQYLQGETGEVAFLKQSNAWSNYKASYRPLVEFAKSHEIPVIAANAPADIVRCIGREGGAYLNALSDDSRAFVAKQAFLNDPDYQAAFAKVMHVSPASGNHSKTGLSNSYLAQLSRDNTMAESILDALADHPNHQVVHVNGAFHSDKGLGTVSLLKQRRNDLKVVVISPVHSGKYKGEEIPYENGDYLYFVTPQPKQYASTEERNAAFQGMFNKSRSKAC